MNTDSDISSTKIKHVIVVLSGKGGVGKSTVACTIASCLLKRRKKVGILDVDLCGPSIPTVLGLQSAQVKSCSEGCVCKVTLSSGLTDI
jgi:Mrp family chromosome partitioning ATPase